MQFNTKIIATIPPVLLVLGFIGLQSSEMPLEMSSVSSEALARFIRRVFPADFSQILEIWPLFDQTLLMTLWGTVLGGFLALFLSLVFGNRYLASSRILKISVTIVALLSRSVPDLLTALLLVSILGTGTLAGIFALAIASIGMFVRLLSTRIEEISLENTIPFAATGMSKLSLRISFVVREIWPYFVSIFGYRLDINLRSAATLGLAGAGGVGIALKLAFGSLNYPSAIAIVIVIALGLLFIEFTANKFSMVLTQGQRDATLARSRIYKFFGRVLLLLVFYYMLAGFFYAVRDARLDVAELLALIHAMFVPDFTSHGVEILNALIQSLSLAAIGVVLGGILALLVGIGAARQSGLPKAVFYFSRIFLVIKRSAPTVLFGIVFVIIFGMGPIAAIAALVLGVGGIGAKFIADSLDQISDSELLSLKSLGLNRFQYLVSGILRIGLPTLVGHFLYMLELNVRYSTILGIIGVGGIGLLISSTIRNNDLNSTMAIIYLIVTIFALLEIASKRFTKSLA